MKPARIPKFTAKHSLGMSFQGYHLARTGNDNIGIIPTRGLVPAMISEGCCGGNCDSPCKAYWQNGQCNCQAT